MFSSRSRILPVLLVLGLLIPGGCSDQAPLAPSTTQAPVTWEKAAPAGYYDTVDTSTPAAMRSSLHAIIDDGIKIPYTSTSTDTWDVEETACQDPNHSNQVLDLYLNAVYPKYGGGNNYYDREHSWPKSYGFPNDGSTNYPYTDCHHLFLANSGYNSSRGNKPFGTAGASGTERTTLYYDGVGGGSGVYPGWSNWYDSTYWETWRDRRGDVARALMYMDVRYEGGVHPGTSNPEPDLILTDNLTLIENSNTGANLSVAYMGLLSVLLQWSQDDPVDAKEMAHNDAVYSFQGNRNPFIDHPEWIDCIFGDTCGGGGGGGGGGDQVAWINEFHYDNASTDTGEFVEVAGTAGLDLSGWTVVGYNGSGGATYSTVNLSGVLPDQQSGFGTKAFTMTGMQNGSPDGLALVDDTGAVVLFISYEGSFAATNGPASGMTSTDVGVAETTSTPVGYSLQLSGSGAAYADFTWQGPQANTSGGINTGQSFSGGGGGGGSWTIITYDDFESGMGSYRDGGSDMSRYSGSNSHQGSYSADIQDNSGASSSFYHSSGHDVSSYTDLEVEFWYKAVSMETGEDFWVQYWDGSAWMTVAAYASGSDFTNGSFNHEIVSIPAGTYNYSTGAKLRFMCDASSNSDDVFIDEIEFRGFK